MYLTPAGNMRWVTPEFYAQHYSLNLGSLYPALRAGRVKGAIRVMGKLWRIPLEDEVYLITTEKKAA
jgi:hypothetical protein